MYSSMIFKKLGLLAWSGPLKTNSSKNFLEKKDVAFYARELNITPKYLSETLMAETGKSAKAIIDEHIFLEAKSLLRQTSMTVQEICNWPGNCVNLLPTKDGKAS